MSDHATALLSRHGNRLRRRLAMAVPPPEGYALLQDKWRLHGLARRLGIPTPVTHRPICKHELRSVAARIDYPCVVKPVSGAGAVGVWRPASEAELLSAHPRNEARHDAVFDGRWPVVQEFVAGAVHEACLLCDRGRVVRALTQRRLRMHPPEGGPGILVETTDEPDLIATAGRLLVAADWHGPAQVEFRRRAEDGKPLLVEVNTRFWGTLELSIRAGVDFPSLTCLLARGEGRPADRGYRIGLRHAWLQPYAVLALCSGRWQATGFEALVDGDTGTDLSAGDWRPHAAAAAGSIVGLLRRPLREAGS
jgi:biotin carboxylase